MKNKKYKNCIICGRVLVSRQKKYCSSQCMTKRYRTDNKEKIKKRKKNMT